MGECLKTRRDGVAYVLPTLDAAYPQDVSFVEGTSTSATFKVAIATDGKPDKYTYQWYVNSSAVSGATSSTYTKTGLTSTGTYSIFCTITNKAGRVQSRVATLSITSYKPTYTYSGNSTFIDDGNKNWRIKFLTSGTLRFDYLGNANSGVDVFLVGAGGGGNTIDNFVYSAGGGGGYTLTGSITPSINTNYSIVIGVGGSTMARGGTSSAFGLSAEGGYGATQPSNAKVYAGNGGSGGAGGTANAGNDGGNGRNASGGGGTTYGGKGQGRTTREFEESSGQVYAGGGSFNGSAGTGGGNNNVAGTANTGGGGGRNKSGGSGIVIIRNHRS